MAGDSSTAHRCWICGSPELQLIRPSPLAEALNNDVFKITDAHYGVTAAIYRCASCGYRECPDIGDVLPFYEGMEDPDYEKTRAPRAVQAQKLLDILAKHGTDRGRLLDVGAGCGILVEEALRLGYAATGVEPSVWLQKLAEKQKLPVVRGSIRDANIAGQFDAVTVIDVIEHVNDPVALMRDVAAKLAPGGVAMVVTPDVDAFFPRILGWKWWHYRIAHISYFNLKTLDMALEQAGLKRYAAFRPTWYLPCDYLIKRLQSYLPKWLHFPLPRFVSGMTVPVNLFDSWLVLAHKP